ncbi:MAG: DUF6671 family protein [Synechococcaceae cyanobacterium ELA445]
MTPESGPPEGPRPGLSPYRGQSLGLASRHGKERAIARPFRIALGLELVLAEGFDTDSLGTFSGERPRANSAERTCLLKAQAAMEHTGLDLGLASEGSFGPHPALPFLACGSECMTFVDRHRGLVIQERLLARRTNFDHRSVGPGDDLGDWLARVGFPRHGLIVRPHLPGGDPLILKDLADHRALERAIHRCAAGSSDGRAWLETDMRAHRNPTRMASIRQLAFRLARRIATPCPACTAPGWGTVGTVTGLPCSWCGHPTSLTAKEVFACGACGHRQELPRSDGLRVADPGQCPLCNP